MKNRITFFLTVIFYILVFIAEVWLMVKLLKWVL